MQLSIVNVAPKLLAIAKTPLSIGSVMKHSTNDECRTRTICTDCCLCSCIYVIASSRTFGGSNYNYMHAIVYSKCPFLLIILFVAVTVFVCVTRGCLPIMFPVLAGQFTTGSLHV